MRKGWEYRKITHGRSNGMLQLLRGKMKIQFKDYNPETKQLQFTVEEEMGDILLASPLEDKSWREDLAEFYGIALYFDEESQTYTANNINNPDEFIQFIR